MNYSALSNEDFSAAVEAALADGCVPQGIFDEVEARHFGGGGDIAGVEKTLRERHLGVQYIVDQEGNVKHTGGPGAQDTLDENTWGTPLGKSLGLNSKNTVGIEVIADPTNAAICFRTPRRRKPRW